jgi:hypothetical protein
VIETMPASILRLPFKDYVARLSVCVIFTYELTWPALLLVMIADKQDLRSKSLVGVIEALISIPVPDHILFTVYRDLLDIRSQGPQHPLILAKKVFFQYALFLLSILGCTAAATPLLL